MKDEQLGVIVVMMLVFTLVNVLFTNYRVLESEELIISKCIGGK